MIDFQQPRALDLVGSPVEVAGQSVVFEANIEWRATLAGAVAEGFFTGGGSVAVRQFQSSLDLTPLLSVDPSKGAEVQISLFSTSAQDGSVQDLVTVPVILGDRLVSNFEGWQPRT
ncbi:MAG: Gmad2 immunoglobulin-like domain-containing protein, partial [Pseudomonadota bacterium]